MPSCVTSLNINRYKCVKNTKLIEQNVKTSKYDSPKYDVKPPKKGTEMLAIAYGSDEMEPACTLENWKRTWKNLLMLG